jgi:hypothetical protein
LLEDASTKISKNEVVNEADKSQELMLDEGAMTPEDCLSAKDEEEKPVFEEEKLECQEKPVDDLDEIAKALEKAQPN